MAKKKESGNFEYHPKCLSCRDTGWVTCSACGGKGWYMVQSEIRDSKGRHVSWTEAKVDCDVLIEKCSCGAAG